MNKMRNAYCCFSGLRAQFLFTLKYKHKIHVDKHITHMNVDT